MSLDTIHTREEKQYLVQVFLKTIATLHLHSGSHSKMRRLEGKQKSFWAWNIRWVPSSSWVNAPWLSLFLLLNAGSCPYMSTMPLLKDLFHPAEATPITKEIPTLIGKPCRRTPCQMIFPYSYGRSQPNGFSSKNRITVCNFRICFPKLRNRYSLAYSCLVFPPK